MLSSALTLTDITQIGFIILTVYLLAFNVISYLSSPRNLPPGPVGFPIVGALPLMRRKPHLVVQAWWKRYGDVCSLYMGSRLVIILNSVDVMKECFVDQSHVFAARPWNYFKKLTKNRGIVFTEGEVWREHRRFTVGCLRDFGMGKVCLETKLHEEVGYFLDEIAMANGAPFDIQIQIPKTVSNIICSIIYGSRFEYDDDVFQANIDALEQSVRRQTMMGMINFLPFLEFLPTLLPNDQLLMRNVEKRDEDARLQLAQHKATLDVDNPRDFIDAYLIRMQNLKNDGIITTFDEGQLNRTIQDLFISGSETVSTTLKWSFLLMILHLDIQDRVYDEINRVVGRGRLPVMKDRVQMPYTQATIMECQRLGNIALFSVPRCTTDDTVVNGYDIPKGTWVFVNRWGVHSSAQYWKQPNVFNPGRFLDRHGQVITPDTFIPFGMGPRKCVGDTLAKMELFIYFTSVLQAFRICIPNNSPIPSMEPNVGLNMSPQDYRISAMHR